MKSETKCRFPCESGGFTVVTSDSVKVPKDNFSIIFLLFHSTSNKLVNVGKKIQCSQRKLSLLPFLSLSFYVSLNFYCYWKIYDGNLIKRDFRVNQSRCESLTIHEGRRILLTVTKSFSPVSWSPQEEKSGCTDILWSKRRI